MRSKAQTPQLRTIFRNTLLCAVGTIALVSVPTTLIFQRKAAVHQLREHILTQKQTIDLVRAKVLSEAIQGNLFQIERYLRDLRLLPGVIDARFEDVSTEDTTEGCSTPELLGAVGEKVCGRLVGPLEFWKALPENLSFVTALTFANRNYGRLIVQARTPPIYRRFWYQTLAFVLVMVILGGFSAYFVGIQIFRRHILEPIAVLINDLDSGKGSSNAKAGHTIEIEYLRQHLQALIERQAEDARLSVCGLIAAEVAHDLRQPLTVLGTFTRNLSAKFHDSRFRERFLTQVPAATEQLARLARDMMDVARADKLTVARVHMNTFVERTVAMYLENHPELGAVVTIDVDPNPVYSEIDEEAMRRVLLNLLDNSMKVLRPGGKIRVRLCAETNETKERTVEMQVKDDGPGISSEVLTYLFKPFFTTAPNGTGLGLAICRRIVTAHGGRISVRTKVGFGSTFRIHLQSQKAA